MFKIIIYLTAKSNISQHLISILHLKVQYLFAKLDQDVIKLSHQMVVDSFSGADVFEFQEHFECSS